MPLSIAKRWPGHKLFETSSIWLVIGIIAAIAVGGIVEIVPLFYLKNTIEQVEGMRPYSPLELAGFNIYVREGCYLCHSQMIRPLRDEVERYGHYSLAAESMYDHPFQWGSKRNGPDLARVGGKYSDDWHRDHMRDPRAVVPTSIMPGYPFLERTPLAYEHIADDLLALSRVGVPYTQEMIDKAVIDLKAQGTPDSGNVDAMLKRYPKAIVRDLKVDKGQLSELDALIAYLQRLGTQVDFKIYDDKANIR
ncbi:MAG: cytochrome-c oxidase, cbb3-type subunit II [Hyphomicrobiales bacterium]